MSTQEDLFAQQEHLDRVRGRIGPAVLEFCESGQVFCMEALVRFIRDKVGVAPDSPSRILRDLRSRGRIGYTVINRRQSLYRVDWVKAA